MKVNRDTLAAATLIATRFPASRSILNKIVLSEGAAAVTNGHVFIRVSDGPYFDNDLEDEMIVTSEQAEAMLPKLGRKKSAGICVDASGDRSVRAAQGEDLAITVNVRRDEAGYPSAAQVESCKPKDKDKKGSITVGVRALESIVAVAKRAGVEHLSFDFGAQKTSFAFFGRCEDKKKNIGMRVEGFAMPSWID